MAGKGINSKLQCLSDHVVIVAKNKLGKLLIIVNSKLTFSYKPNDTNIV